MPIIIGLLGVIVGWLFFGVLSYGLLKGAKRNELREYQEQWQKLSKNDSAALEYLKYSFPDGWKYTAAHEAQYRKVILYGFLGLLYILVVYIAIHILASIPFSVLGSKDHWGFCLKMPKELCESQHSG